MSTFPAGSDYYVGTVAVNIDLKKFGSHIFDANIGNKSDRLLVVDTSGTVILDNNSEWIGFDIS